VQIGKCDLAVNSKNHTPHPGFVFKRPVAGVHVRLENTATNKLLWDAEFLGTGGGPIKLLPWAAPQDGEQPEMLPICAETLEDLVQNTDLKLTIDELPPQNDPTDPRFPSFSAEYTFKPRPLGDHIVYKEDLDQRYADFFRTGNIQGAINQL
jgi:hypothetical protein